MNKPVEFYDIYNYIYVPFWQTTWFRVVILIFFLCALVGVLSVWYVRRQKAKNQQKPLSVAQQALAELAQLTPNTYRTKEEFKQFYFALAHIMKTFLQKQFSWAVLEKTDTELINYLRSRSFDQKLLSPLEKVLSGSLLIKFANEQTLRETAINDIAIVVDFVKKASTPSSSTTPD